MWRNRNTHNIDGMHLTTCIWLANYLFCIICRHMNKVKMRNNVSNYVCVLDAVYVSKKLDVVKVEG